MSPTYLHSTRKLPPTYCRTTPPARSNSIRLLTALSFRSSGALGCSAAFKICRVAAKEGSLTYAAVSDPVQHSARYQEGSPVHHSARPSPQGCCRRPHLAGGRPLVHHDCGAGNGQHAQRAQSSLSHLCTRGAGVPRDTLVTREAQTAAAAVQ